MSIHIGTSGWVYPHWRGVFYPVDLPRSAWLDFYAGRFDTVELNNTFYRLPPAKTFDGWGGRALQGFRYAVKASRYLTHMKKLKPAAGGLEAFVSAVRRLGASLGPVLWQLPPRWHANAARLEHHAERLPDDIPHAFEFRDPDWFQDQIRDVLTHHRLSFCIYDWVDCSCPLWVTSSTVYLRFHGPAVKYGGKYGRERLRPWADRIRAWHADGLDVFVYFNNDLGGFAVEDATTLRQLVGR